MSSLSQLNGFTRSPDLILLDAIEVQMFVSITLREKSRGRIKAEPQAYREEIAAVIKVWRDELIGISTTAGPHARALLLLKCADYVKEQLTDVSLDASGN